MINVYTEKKNYVNMIKAQGDKKSMLSCIFMERKMEDKPNESIQKRNTADSF